MSDPLAQYRRKPITAAGVAPSEPEGYVAFGTKDKVERLRIRRRKDPTRAPGYGYLLDIVYDEKFGKDFVLVYSFIMVLCTGKNLRSVVMALEVGTCDFIQEFDPARWGKPPEGAPVIESIEVIVRETGPQIGESEASMTLH